MLYAKVDILATCGEHLHDISVSLGVTVWPDLTSLTTHFISTCTKPGKCAAMYLCDRVSILPFSTILLLNSGTASTVFVLHLLSFKNTVKMKFEF